MIKRNVTIELDGKIVSMDDITNVKYNFLWEESVRLDIDTKSQGLFHFESGWDNLNEVKKIMMLQRIIENHASGPLPANES